MYICFFDSYYGYNSLVRIDRLYTFNTRECVKYLLEVNRDLVDKSIWIRIFISKVKKYLRVLRILKKILPKHIRSIENGETHWNTIFHILDKSI